MCQFSVYCYSGILVSLNKCLKRSIKSIISILSRCGYVHSGIHGKDGVPTMGRVTTPQCGDHTMEGNVQTFPLSIQPRLECKIVRDLGKLIQLNKVKVWIKLKLKFFLFVFCALPLFGFSYMLHNFEGNWGKLFSQK